jgi:cell wall-associated NlpC family hydrolase
MTKQDVVNQARKYLGVRYKHQGRTEFGLDCLGLLVKVARDLGISKADSNDYGRMPDGRKMMRQLEEHLDITTEPEPGDILLFRFQGEPRHLAIKTDIGMIHSYAEQKKVVEHRMDEVWQDRLVRSYKIRNL